MKIEYTLKDFDKGKIISKYGMQKNGDLHLFFSDSCFRRMHKYVPFASGTLASHATVRPKSVTYEERYAHRQYTTNKGKGIRGKYWDKKMIANERDVLTREVENEAKRLKGSK
jgi:hypothetical protein